MRTEDQRLDREVREQIAVSSSFTEHELDYSPGNLEDDRDYQLIEDQLQDMIDSLEYDQTGRQAIALTDKKACIVGVQVLVRDYIHVLAWLRSSDIQEYRTSDVQFLASVADTIRGSLDLQLPYMVHIFTSSLHEEVL